MGPALILLKCTNIVLDTSVAAFIVSLVKPSILKLLKLSKRRREMMRKKRILEI